MFKSMNRPARRVIAACCSAAAATAIALAVPSTAFAQEEDVPCYNTQRDATYNRPGCSVVRHWVTRSSTGTARTHGAWVGIGGVSMVISYVDWTGSGTEVA